MKRVLFLIYLLMITLQIFPQHTVSLKIINENTQNIPKASVEINNSKYISDEKGNLKIKLQNGKYLYKVSAIGYKTHSDTISIFKDTLLTVILKEDPFNLNSILVTGTYSKHTYSSAPITTSIITSNDIQNTNLTLNEVLVKNSINLDLKNTIARTQAIQMNGFSGNHVLVLIDGQRIAGKMDGTIDLNFLSFTNIERIEIVKGPFSSLYGSDALGGVINIITQNNKNHLTSLKFQTKVSSLVSKIENNPGINTQDYNLNYSSFLTITENIYSKYDINLSYSNNNQIDYNKYDNFFELPEIKKYSVAANINSYFYDNLSIKLKLNYSLDSLHWLAGDKYNPFRNKVSNQRYFTNLTSEYKFNTTNKLYLSINNSFYNHKMIEYYNWYKLKSDIQKEYLTDFNTYYQFTPYSTSLITIGYQNISEKIKSDRIENQTKIQVSNNLFIEDEWQFPIFTLNFGLRYSSNSTFGNFISPKISTLYKITDQLLAKFSYGKGYRAPSLKELFINYSNAAVGYNVIGEPNLKPEKSDGFNFSLEYFNDNLAIKNYNYYNKLTNLIDYYYKNSNTLSYYNINKATIAGTELEITYLLGQKFDFVLGYNYTYAVNKENKKLPFRSPQTLLFKITYNFNKENSIKLISKWYDKKLVNDEQIDKNLYNQNNGGINTISYYQKAYSITDLIYNTKFYDFSFVFGISNIFDNYSYPFGNIKGREIFINIIYQLN